MGCNGWCARLEWSRSWVVMVSVLASSGVDRGL